MDPDFGPDEDPESPLDDPGHQLPKRPSYPLLQDLVDRLGHRHLSQRLQALGELRLLTLTSGVAISAIVSALEDRSQHVRDVARAAIDAIGARALPALIEAFRRSDEPAAWKGLDMLRRFPKGEALVLARAGDEWPAGGLTRLLLSEPATLPFELSDAALTMLSNQLSGSSWNGRNFALEYIQKKPQIALRLIPELMYVGETARGVDQRLTAVEALGLGVGTGEEADDKALKTALEQLRDHSSPSTIAGAATMLITLHADAALQGGPLVKAIASPDLPRSELRPVLHFLSRHLARNRLGFAAVVIDLLHLRWRIREERQSRENPPESPPSV